MKILSKVEINTLKAAEKKKEIDDGLKLAKSVDNLRETKAKEEENLRKFRDQSLQGIKADINSLLEQKNVVIRDLEALEQRKKEAEAPIDLTQKYREVELSRKENENLKRELKDREMEISIKEIELIEIEKREKKLKEKEKEIELQLEQSSANYQRTEDIRSSMEQRKKEVEEAIAVRVQEIEEKEKELISREYAINQSKDEIKQDKKDLLERGTSLIERESTVEAKTKEFIEREEAVKEKEALSNRYNSEADKNYSITENLKAEAQKLRDDAELEITNRFRTLSEREREMSYKEHDFLLEKEKVENDKKDIEKERILIASRQEQLRVAWLNIKK